jgi:hypothetical protein
MLSGSSLCLFSYGYAYQVVRSSQEAGMSSPVVTGCSLMIQSLEDYQMDRHDNRSDGIRIRRSSNVHHPAACRYIVYRAGVLVHLIHYAFLNMPACRVI